MAINTANSNFVNISNLPQSQEALGTDLFIIQTENGTQTITYDNLNLVKTYPNGDTVLPGNLTGSYSFFTKISGNEILAPIYKTSRSVGSGNYPLAQYFNRFTFDGGLMTSATYIAQSSPDYSEITANFVPAVTSYLGGLFKRVYEFQLPPNQIPYATVIAGTSAVTVTIPNFFTTYPDLTPSIIRNPTYFTLSPIDSTASTPWVDPTSIGYSNFAQTDLSFTINTGYLVPVSKQVRIYYRFLYFKSV